MNATCKLFLRMRKLPTTAENVRNSTLRDPVLKKVLKYVKTSWPRKVESKCKQYFNIRTLLSELNDCILFEGRVVIPSDLRSKVLKEIHIGHPGIVRMKRLARSLVFWPGLDSDCERIVKECSACQNEVKTPTKVPLQTWTTPERVWQRIHIDSAGPTDGMFYLVIVDAKSKWPEMIAMQHITARNTVKAMLNIFVRYGMPETIVSDNGTQFTSQEFKDMCEQNGIKHMRTSPYHPQSNGHAERFVDILKRRLRKQKGEGKTTEEALRILLLAYRSTPSELLDGETPAEVFLGRKLRTTLNLLQPMENTERVQSELQSKTEKQFNLKHGTQERNFQVGNYVMIKNYHGLKWNWKRAKVVRKIGNVNYELELEGKRVRRHANQIRNVQVPAFGSESDEGDAWLDVMLSTFNLQPTAIVTAAPDAQVGPAADPPVQMSPVRQPQPQNVQAVPQPVNQPAAVPPLRRSSRQPKPVVPFDPSC